MSLFVEPTPITVQILGQSVTLQVLAELSVDAAIAAQQRPVRSEEEYFEGGLDMLLAYVQGWDQEQPWGEATLRKLRLDAFEALVLAVSEAVAPATQGDEEVPSGN